MGSCHCAQKDMLSDKRAFAGARDRPPLVPSWTSVTGDVMAVTYSLRSACKPTLPEGVYVPPVYSHALSGTACPDNLGPGALAHLRPHDFACKACANRQQGRVLCSQTSTAVEVFRPLLPVQEFHPWGQGKAAEHGMVWVDLTKPTRVCQLQCCS